MMSELLVSEWLIFFFLSCLVLPPLLVILLLLSLAYFPYFPRSSPVSVPLVLSIPPQLLASCGPWLCYILCLFCCFTHYAVSMRGSPQFPFPPILLLLFFWFALRHSFSASISVFRFSLAFVLCGSLPYYFSLSLCCAVSKCAVPMCSPSFLLFFH